MQRNVASFFMAVSHRFQSYINPESFYLTFGVNILWFSGYKTQSHFFAGMNVKTKSAKDEIMATIIP